MKNLTDEMICWNNGLHPSDSLGFVQFLRIKEWTQNIDLHFCDSFKFLQSRNEKCKIVFSVTYKLVEGSYKLQFPWWNDSL